MATDYLVHTETEDSDGAYVLGFYQGQRCTLPRARVVSKQLCTSPIHFANILRVRLEQLDPFQRYDHPPFTG